MSRQVTRAAPTGLAMALILPRCGGSGGGPSMTSGAASQLRTGVDAVHAAVAPGDRAQAVPAFAASQTTVTQLRPQGPASTDRAAAILGATADAEAELGLLSTTTTITSPDHPSQKDHQGGDGDGDWLPGSR